MDSSPSDVWSKISQSLTFQSLIFLSICSKTLHQIVSVTPANNLKATKHAVLMNTIPSDFPLIGVGGLSHVYQLPIQSLCLKLSNGTKTSACFGRYCSFPHKSKNTEEPKTDLIYSEAMYRPWGSNSFYLLENVCSKHLQEIFSFEYERLLHFPRDFPTVELFPRVLQHGTIGSQSYYIMERLPGQTLRAWLTQSLKNKQANSTKKINLMPTLIDLLSKLNYLFKETYETISQFHHGDIKPENIILDIGPSNQVTLKLIDPIPFPLYQNIVNRGHQKAKPPNSLDRQGFYGLVSLQYNPKASLRENADTIGLALIMIEIMSGKQPFSQIHETFQYTSDFETYLGVMATSDQILAPHFKEFDSDPFLSWAIQWLSVSNSKRVQFSTLDFDSTPDYEKMHNQLVEWQKKGIKLELYL